MGICLNLDVYVSMVGVFERERERERKHWMNGCLNRFV